MTGVHNGDVEHPSEHQLGPIVETVRLTALELIASLPERPTRLRVRAAGVTVDLDWRQSPLPAMPPPTNIEQAGPLVVGAEPNGVATKSEPRSGFVCAPAVGTFYHAPDPGKPPFVEPGALIEVGQQVGIIEAMKLMLPVQAECSGQVVGLLVADGHAVEYGDQLIEIRPAA
jgi:acetyl-CoA carboxylase biotin carboxyl carrier protein